MTKAEKDTNISNNQNNFSSAYKNWILSDKRDSESYKIMFSAIYFACINICKSKAYGIHLPDLESKALDATCNCIEKLKTFSKVEECPKLSSWCYLYCIGQIYNKKYIRWERSECFDDLFDNYSYYNEDGIATICRSTY